MNGTRSSQTLAMPFTPKMTTEPMRMARTSPIHVVSHPKLSAAMVEMALLWMVQPMPKVARNAKRANSTASHLQPMPRSMAYMGPPSIVPSFVVMRYLIESRPSAYLVAMPNTPVTQHQKTAPGPPIVTAVATPMMLPVPMVAARPVARAANCETSPFEFASRWNDSLMALPM